MDRRHANVAARRYGLVLAGAIATFVLLAAGGDGVPVRILAAVLQAGLVALSFWAAGEHPRVRRLGVGLALLGCLAALLSLVGTDDVRRALPAIVGALAVLTSAATLGQGVLALPTIDRRTISAALTIYLLVGLFFSNVYAAIDAISSGDFFAGGRSDTIAHLLYFSYVTQTTVGYGDFTAASNLGRTLAVVEALVGQLYLVTVVALTVSNLGRVRARPGSQA